MASRRSVSAAVCLETGTAAGPVDEVHRKNQVDGIHTHFGFRDELAPAKSIIFSSFIRVIDL